MALPSAPFNLWDGSIRSGKTFLSILWLINVNNSCPEGDAMIIGQTPQTLERNFLNSLMSFLGEGNYHYKTGERLDIFYFVGNERKTRRFYIVGAKDVGAIRRIRGSTLEIAYIDEGTLLPQTVFDELVGRLSSATAKCLITTNPDSPNHWLLKEYAENPEAKKDWRRFKFLLEDNLSLDIEYVERIKRQYRGIPARYQRMILGRWVVAEGVIYQKFDKARHVVTRDQVPKTGLRRMFVGGDYGVGNPTTFLLIGEYKVGTDIRYYVLKEYYYSGRESMKSKTTSEYGKDFSAWLKGNRALQVAIDPSAAALITELELPQTKRDAGVMYVVEHAKNDVLEGIQVVANMFADDNLYIVDSCKKTIEELGIYSWDAKAQAKGEDKPIKDNDHCMDGLRYAMNTFVADYGTISSRSGW